MMNLSKPVTRRTAAPIFRYGRHLIVTLEPGDVLTLQLEGETRVHRISLGDVFLLVVGRGAANRRPRAQKS